MTEKEIYKSAVDRVCHDKMDKALDFDRQRSSKHKKIKRLAAVIAAAAVITICAAGVYAFQRGWLSSVFGDSADVIYGSGKDYSALLENVSITCDDPDYIFEYITADAVGEFLFFELKVSRVDGRPVYPAEYNDFPTALDARSGYVVSGDELCWAELGSSAVSSESDGSMIICGYLLKPDGVKKGDHAVVEYDKLYIKDDGSYSVSGNVISNGTVHIRMNVKLEFDVSETPLKNRNVCEVNKTARFESGNTYKINSISVSPFSVQILAEEEDIYNAGALDFDDCFVIFKDGTEKRVMGHAGTAQDGIYLLFDGFINTDDISAVRIGDLAVEL